MACETKDIVALDVCSVPKLDQHHHALMNPQAGLISKWSVWFCERLQPADPLQKWNASVCVCVYFVGNMNDRNRARVPSAKGQSAPSNCHCDGWTGMGKPRFYITVSLLGLL